MSIIDSPYTGLFTASGRVPAAPGDPEIALWSATLARGLDVGGAAWTEEAARDAAFGEGVERYRTSPIPADERIESSFERLDAEAVEPERWVLFHPEQYARPGFPFRPFTRSTTCRWTACRRAADGARVLAPEDFVYLFLDEHRIAPGLSTGLVAGRRGHPLVLRGAQEVVERDALVGAWWGRYPLEEWRRPLDPRLARPWLRWRFFRVRTPHTAHATIVTAEGDGLFAAGSAVRETREASWEKASLEAAHSLAYVRRALASTDVDRLDSFAAHACYYSRHPQRLASTPFARPVAPDERGAEEVEGLPQFPVLYRLLTPPGLEDWVVLRVLIPGLQPLHGIHGLAHLGGPLWAPRGLADYADTPPHPFA